MFRSFLVTGALALCAISHAEESPADRDPRALLESIRSATLSPERAVRVRDVEIDLHGATLFIVDGVLAPVVTADGALTEALFAGVASFRHDPDDRIERQQLRLFTGQESLQANVTHAVLVAGDPSTLAQILGAGEPGVAELVSDEAEAFLASWRDGATRRQFAVDRTSWRARLGDGPSSGYFAALCRGEVLGDFFYRFDPGEVEQVELGQWVPLEGGERDRYELEEWISRERRRGKMLDTDIDDLGVRDTWVRRSAHGADGPSPGSSSFEPVHYEIEATLASSLDFAGVTTVQLRAEVPDARVVGFTLFSDLRVTSAQDGEGTELAFVQEGPALDVVLPHAVDRGQQVSVRIEYGGLLFEKVDNRALKGVPVNRDTFGWYPHVGTTDRATYVLTVRWPKKWDLMGSGAIVESGEESGQRWERRQIDIPVFGVTFEVGNYKVLEAQVGHVALKVGFTKGFMGASDGGVREEVLETLRSALLEYEERFGAYPLDHLSVVTTPHGFSQGLQGFITLAWPLMFEDSLDISQPYERNRRAYQRVVDRTETIAHELAHQWWGGKVGWAGYRDQWLSEALANYSALIYMSDRVAYESIYQEARFARWQRGLGLGDIEGRAIGGLGPVTLGSRLRSSKGSAYGPVVYGKGAIVFRMLARSLGQEPFHQMLSALADAVNQRAIDTPTFIRSLERMSGRDLSAFANEFIYGTSEPTMFYTYTIEQNGDGWKISGVAEREAAAFYRYRIEPLDGSGWSVVRERASQPDPPTYAMVVPFQVELAATVDDKKGAGRAVRGLGGTLVLQGASTRFEIPLKQEPVRFWLDQRHELLADFSSEEHGRQIYLMNKARMLDGNEAVALYREAISADYWTAEEQLAYDSAYLRRGEARADARAGLALVRTLLDMRDWEAAAIELDAVDDRLKGPVSNYMRESRQVLQARIELALGETESAYKRLNRIVGLDFDRDFDESIASTFRRSRFGDGRRTRSVDALLSLAAAARATGRDSIADQAIRQAEERGADASALTRSTHATAGD